MEEDLAKVKSELAASEAASASATKEDEELKVKLDVEINFISSSAREKIEKLGGKVSLIK